MPGMTYADAVAVLQSEGLRVELRAFGVEGWSDDHEGRLTFQIGRSSDGGDELSIRRDAPGQPLPDGPTRWFWSPTLEELVTFLVNAQRQVSLARSASLFAALLEQVESGETPVLNWRFG